MASPVIVHASGPALALTPGDTTVAVAATFSDDGGAPMVPALDPALRPKVLPLLARCYLDTGRAVAAAGLIESLRAAGHDVTALEAKASAALGEAWAPWRRACEGRRAVVVPIDGTVVSAEG